MRKKNRVKLRFRGMQTVIALFMLVAVLLFLLQKNVIYKSSGKVLDILSEDDFQTYNHSTTKECVILWEKDANGEKGREMMEDVLGQMKIPYDMYLGKEFDTENLENYTTMVLSMTNLQLLDEGILDIMDWVAEGGNLMLLYPPEINGTFSFIQNDLGIIDIGDEMKLVEGLEFTQPFMLGGEGKEYAIEEPYNSSLALALDGECEVYLQSNDENPTPIIWKRTLEQGSIVFANLGFMDKVYRGFYSSAYSLLGDYCVYPVINASTYYIDDFPSPVPDGDNIWIQKAYGLNIKEFYSQVWWSDVYSLAKKYGIHYTGLVIEAYSDQIERPFERTGDMQRFQYFGNMLLDQGGEIGFHGYNHMPLCLPNFDFQGQYDSYKRWSGYDDMKAGLQELNDFCSLLFPKEEFHVYVPPSNILSEEGRNMLLQDFSQIKAIASVYLPGGLAYEQEFSVSEDGMIETPRVISGYILDDYMQLAALAELNFHFVNTHFQHPDDVLDEDRGASLGWEEMFRRISEYTKWLYTAAPDIRSLTGSELAAAVQRYHYLDVKRTKENNELQLSLDGFADEAWLMLRINDGEPGMVTGGELSKLLDGLYLLKAESSEVSIELKR